MTSAVGDGAEHTVVKLFHLDGRIAFEILFLIAPILRNGTLGQVDIVANNSGPP